MARVHVSTRSAEMPTILSFARSHGETAHALVAALDELQPEHVLFVFGRTSRQLIGGSLLIDCPARLGCTTIQVAGAHVDEVERIRAAIAAERVDVVVGCGGGQTLDAGKYAAFQDDVPFISIPTQATHDGICSPVAVLRGPGDARASSYGTRPPTALIVPLHVIGRAPRRALVSGIADLAANLIAVEDWTWAHEFRGEPLDDYAALLARSAAQLILARRHLFAPDRDFTSEDVEIVVHGLVLSGLAMTLAGSSRPCSGPEHLISHAFDLLGLGTGTHGEQVAVASVLACNLYGRDFTPILELLKNLGAPLSPAELGISREDAVRAVKMAHLVRPDRQSRLSNAIIADPEFVEEKMRAAWFG
jgi:glycerol-1-phosphate dehydrogenase [NAD(P)+]